MKIHHKSENMLKREVKKLKFIFLWQAQNNDKEQQRNFLKTPLKTSKILWPLAINNNLRANNSYSIGFNANIADICKNKVFVSVECPFEKSNVKIICIFLFIKKYY